MSVAQCGSKGMAVDLARIIKKGFKKCCISTALDATDDMLWNGSEEDGKVGS
jgi:hypothetical protein